MRKEFLNPNSNSFAQFLTLHYPKPRNSSISAFGKLRLLGYNVYIKTSKTNFVKVSLHAHHVEGALHIFKLQSWEIMSLRVPAVSQNHESRPLPPERDNKKPSFFKRWGCSSAISLRNRNRHNSNNDTCNHQPCRKNQSNGSTSMTSSTSYNSFDIDLTFSPNETNISNRTDRSQNSVGMPKNKLNMATCKNHVSSQSAMKSRAGPVNIMHWMQYDCPKDVIPLVLAFAGPQKMATIGRINRFWRQVFDQEATWNRLCESLYKVRCALLKLYYLLQPFVPLTLNISLTVIFL